MRSARLPVGPPNLLARLRQQCCVSQKHDCARTCVLNCSLTRRYVFDVTTPVLSSLIRQQVQASNDADAPYLVSAAHEGGHGASEPRRHYHPRCHCPWRDVRNTPAAKARPCHRLSRMRPHSCARWVWPSASPCLPQPRTQRRPRQAALLLGHKLTHSSF